MAGTTASRFSTNVWWLTVSQVTYRLATIAVFGYIGQVLGANVLGQYAIIMGVLNLYMSFSDLGVSNFVIKEVSQNRALGTLYLDNFFVLQIITGAIIIVLALLTGELSGYSTIIMWGLAIGSAGLVFNGMANAYKALLSAQEVLFPFAIIEVLCMAVYVIGNLLVIVFQQGVLALVAVTVAVQGTKYIAGALWARRYDARVSFHASGTVIKSMLILGLPFLLFNSAHFAIQRLDVIFIGALDTETASGTYAGASRLVYSSLFVISVIGTALYPVLSRLLHENKARVEQLYYQSSSYLFITACLGGLAFFTLAPFIVHTVLGNGFPESIRVLQIIAWYIPVFALGLLPSNMLMVGDKVWSAARVSILGVGCMAALVFGLYSSAGITGVAVIVTSIEALLSILYLALSWKHFRLGFVPSKVLPTIGILALSLGAYYALADTHFWLQAIAPLAIFIAAVFVFRVMRRSDLSVITGILLKRTAPGS